MMKYLKSIWRNTRAITMYKNLLKKIRLLEESSQEDSTLRRIFSRRFDSSLEESSCISFLQIISKMKIILNLEKPFNCVKQ